MDIRAEGLLSAMPHPFLFVSPDPQHPALSVSLTSLFLSLSLSLKTKKWVNEVR